MIILIIGKYFFSFLKFKNVKSNQSFSYKCHISYCRFDPVISAFFFSCFYPRFIKRHKLTCSDLHAETPLVVQENATFLTQKWKEMLFCVLPGGQSAPQPMSDRLWTPVSSILSSLAAPHHCLQTTLLWISAHFLFTADNKRRVLVLMYVITSPHKPNDLLLSFSWISLSSFSASIPAPLSVLFHTSSSNISGSSPPLRLPRTATAINVTLQFN